GAGEALEALIRLDPTEMKYLSWYASAQQDLGDFYNRYQLLDEALKHFEEAAKVLEKTADTKGQEVTTLFALINAYESAAAGEKRRARPESAASYFQRAIDACEKALRHQPGEQEVCLLEVRQYKARAELYEAEDPSSALKDYQAALRIWNLQVLPAPDFSRRDFLLDDYLALCTEGARGA